MDIYFHPSNPTALTPPPPPSTGSWWAANCSELGFMCGETGDNFRCKHPCYGMLDCLHQVDVGLTHTHLPYERWNDKKGLLSEYFWRQVTMFLVVALYLFTSSKWSTTLYHAPEICASCTSFWVIKYQQRWTFAPHKPYVGFLPISPLMILYMCINTTVEA